MLTNEEMSKMTLQELHNKYWALVKRSEWGRANEVLKFVKENFNRKGGGYVE